MALSSALTGMVTLSLTNPSRRGAHPRHVNKSIIAAMRRGEPMKSKYAAARVAEWMLNELKRQGKLHQDTVVYEIVEKFGSQFTYDDEDGNLAVRIDVLAAFRKLTKDSVVWVAEDCYWRMCDPHDESGRRQD